MKVMAKIMAYVKISMAKMAIINGENINNRNEMAISILWL